MPHDPSTYVTGVPVRISEAFRPPRKVALPSSCPYTVDADLFTDEYDIRLETKVISWIESNNEKKQKAKQDRQVKISEFRKKKAEEKQKSEQLKEAKRLQEIADKKKRLCKTVDSAAKTDIGAECSSVISETLSMKNTESKWNESDLEDVESFKTDLNILESMNSSCSPGPIIGMPKSKAGVENNSHSFETNLKQSDVSSAFTSSSETSSSINNVYFSQKQLESNVSLQQSVLKPIPATYTQTPLSNLTDENFSKAGNNSKTLIDFSDFEGDRNDPFDSAALKSINDMEELAKVLQPCSLSNVHNQEISASPKIIPVSNYCNSSSSLSGIGVIPGLTAVPPNLSYSSIYPSRLCPVPPNCANHLYGNSVSNTQLPRESIDVSNSIFGCQVTSPSIPVAAGSGPSGLPTFYQLNKASAIASTAGGASNVSYPLWTSDKKDISNALTCTSAMTAAANCTAYGMYGYGLPPVSSSGYSKGAECQTNLNYSASLVQPPATVDLQRTYRQQPGTLANQVQQDFPAPNHRPDLEDFYSRYYGSPTTSSTSSQITSLRSSKSVPDLTAAEDQEVSSLSRKLTPKQLMGDFEPRPSSTGPFVGFMTSLHSHPETPYSHRASSGTLQATVFSTESTEPQDQGPLITLGDPFNELDPEAQTVVLSVTEMGFPRPRVARAIQRLGIQHKKLIEVLLELQALQESGEDADRAEVAFYAHFGDAEKTRQHLANTRQLVSLGFAEPRVTALLIKHNNDTDKTLEELIAQ